MSEDSPELPESAFAPPADSTEGRPRPDWGRVFWLVRNRALRLGAAALVWGLWAQLLWPRPDGVPFLIGAVTGLLVWGPSSLALARIVFLPGEPRADVRDVTGRPVAPEDYRWLHRLLVMEHLLGLLPLGLFAAWAVAGPVQLPLWVLVIAGPMFVLALWQQLRVVRRLLLIEASVALALEQPTRALRSLDLLARLRRPTAEARRLREVAERRLRSE